MSKSISTPDMTSLQEIATVTYNNEPYVSVFWNQDTQKVNINYKGETWYQQEDCNIIDTLCCFLTGAKDYNIVANNIRVLYKKTNDVETSEELMEDVYNCIWSDLVFSSLMLNFNIRVFPWLTSKENRLAAAIRYESTDATTIESQIPEIC